MDRLAQYGISPLPPALRNRQILRIIFDEFTVRDTWEESSLAASACGGGQEVDTSQRRERAKRRIQLRDLAVTCKDFKEVALDCLWYTVPSLLPLLKVVPTLELLYSTYTIREPIPENSAFFRYAARIRVMDLWYPRRSRREPKYLFMAWISVALDLKGEPLCPNASTLSMTIDDSAEQKDAFAILPLLLSPKIRTAKFSGPGLSPHTFETQCLSLLSRISGTLRTLVIDSQQKTLGSDVLDPIRDLTNLQTLEIRLPSTPSINPNAIYEMVQSLKELRSLTLDIHFTSKHQPQATNALLLSAEALKLHLPLSSLRLISRVADGICPCIPRFLLEHRTASVTILFPESMDFNAPGVFAPMARSLSKLKPLKYLQFSFATSGSLSVDGRKTSLPFLGQANAEEMEIDFPTHDWPLALFIQHAFANRPLTGPRPLKTLIIRRSMHPRNDEGLTFSCLMSVAQDGLGLEHLKAPLRRSFLSKFANRHSTIGAWLAALLQGPKSKSTLKSLTIFDPCNPGAALSPEEHHTHSQIAQVMDLLFPSLEEIKPYEEAESYEAYWRNRWGQIESLRRSYQSARFYGSKQL